MIIYETLVVETQVYICENVKTLGISNEQHYFF